MVRTGLRAALFSIGFRTVSDTASFIRLHDAIANDEVDLLVTSSELEGNDVGFLIQEMRHQRLGTNPFLTTIGLLANAEPDYVKRVIDSGVDDLLLTPVIPDQLIMRIEKLSRTRKPFVITHDYTGPDRRAATRTFTNHSAPLMEVPNPLHDKVTGIGLKTITERIRDAAATCNRLKIERNAVQVEWLVGHINASIRDGMGDGASLIPHTHRLVLVAEDMIARMKGTSSEKFLGSVNELLEVVRRLDQDPSNIAFADIERTHTLSRTISRALSGQNAGDPGKIKQAC